MTVLSARPQSPPELTPLRATVKLRCLAVFGTRPEVIKLYPLITELRQRPNWRVTACHTGQHRSLVDALFLELGLPPDCDLRVMHTEQTLPSLVARIIERLEPVIRAHRPHMVVVQGDTTSAMAAALCAFGMQIPVIHIEAGLRTGDLDAPYPEEANRRIIASVATLHFAPTRVACDNVLREFPTARAYVVGNTGLDALRMVRARLAETIPVAPTMRHVLVTIHRREHLEAHLTSVCAAIRELAERYPDMAFSVPLHPNPSVRPVAARMLGGVPRVTLIAPMPYQEMVRALHGAWLVMTDSGGLQEEAAFVGRPTLILRSQTDRPEGVLAGVATVIGTDAGTIVREVCRLHDNPLHYASMCRPTGVFGDGRSCARIAEVMEQEFLGPWKSARAVQAGDLSAGRRVRAGEEEGRERGF